MAAEARKREYWVDNVKVIACIFVVLGHFFQSLAGADIIADGKLFLWFNDTVYLFHIQLFFICSGYLYQKYSRVRRFSEWKRSAAKKLLNLGIPYIFFILVSWVLKSLFSSSVNSQAGSLTEALLIKPMSPYWFLLCLIMIFLITPTLKYKYEALILLAASFGARAFYMLHGSIGIKCIDSLFEQYFWFACGMALALINTEKAQKKPAATAAGALAVICFIAGSVAIFSYQINNKFILLLLSAVMCFGTILLSITLSSDDKQNRIMKFLSGYILPIFLMHTLFAAPLRALLLRFSITNPAVHIILGIIISFAGPVIAEYILNKTVILDFFVYPQKTIKRIKEGRLK